MESESHYTYNHAGDRVIKSHGPTTVAFVNGAPQDRKSGKSNSLLGMNSALI